MASSPLSPALALLVRYATALIVALMAVPGIVAAMTTFLYLLPPIHLFSFLAPEWYPIVAGWIITLIIWLVLAVFVSPFTTADHANTFQYNLLDSRFSVLRSHLNIIREKIREKTTPLSLEQIEAFEEADACENVIFERLYHARPGLRWILGRG